MEQFQNLAPMQNNFDYCERSGLGAGVQSMTEKCAQNFTDQGVDWGAAPTRVRLVR